MRKLRAVMDRKVSPRTPVLLLNQPVSCCTRGGKISGAVCDWQAWHAKDTRRPACERDGADAPALV